MSDNAQSAAGDGERKGGSARRSDVHGYWRQNLIVIGILLFIWATVSYGCSIFWVEYLNQYRMGELPLGFWFAQQGSMYVFVVLIFVYAFAMDRLDRKYGVQE